MIMPVCMRAAEKENATPKVFEQNDRDLRYASLADTIALRRAAHLLSTAHIP